MAGSYWKSGWQENAFVRCKEYISSSPAFFQNISPADAAEDAYLLALASALFLRDEAGAQPPPRRALSARSAPPAKVKPFGIPAFSCERCLARGQEGSMAFDAALEGRLGALHRKAAELAGSKDAWTLALTGLHDQRCLLPECPADPPLFSPPLRPFGEDLADCFRAVIRKAGRAFKIGFGLWGRWESA